MYPNQAFRIGDVVWGLQFHIEVDEAAVVGFLDAFGSELEEMAVGPEGIRREAPSAVPALAPWRDHVLGRFVGLVTTQVSGGGPVAGRTDFIVP